MKTVPTMLLFSAAAVVAASAGSVHAAALTPQADFEARCAAPGVLVCEGFDSASTFVFSPYQADGLYPPYGQSAVGGFQDASIKASGASALRFDIHGNTGSDPAGNFSKNFGVTFGQNSTFYIQFRQRFDTNMLTIDWNGLMGTSFKQSVIYDQDGVPCANIELATTNNYATNIPLMYSQCGGRSLRTSLADFTQFTTDVPYYYQQGSSLSSGYNCEFDREFAGTGNGAGCFYYAPDQWLTFYYKVQVGTWGSPNSYVEAWVAFDGGPYRQWTHVRDYTLFHDGNANGGFSRVMLTPYMTNKDSSVNHATARTWYDELIVSTQPIAAPGNAGSAGTVPDAPRNLRVVP